MSEIEPRPGWIDSNKFTEAISKIPPEELAKYAGMHVAYSRDGTRILASGATWDELYDNMDAAGLKSNETVEGYVDFPGMVLL